MRLLSFIVDGRLTYGIVRDDRVIDLQPRFGRQASGLKTLIDMGLDQINVESGEGGDQFGLQDITYAPVIPDPEKIIGVGLNYEDHRLETGRPKAAYPTIFSRYAASQVGHNCDIVLPRVSTELDYEGELGVVIGKPGRYIPAEKALDHVAGYTCYNDATLRDWQRHSHQFTPGKNFPGTGAFGPWLVTADEVGDLGERILETHLNGKLMQRASLSQMIFSVPEIIEYVSSFTPLVPGDVIASGTPGGVGFKRQPPVWMKAGDVIEVTIEGIGRLRNTVVNEPD